MCTQFRLAPGLPERNCCVGLGMSGCIKSETGSKSWKTDEHRVGRPLLLERVWETACDRAPRVWKIRHVFARILAWRLSWNLRWIKPLWRRVCCTLECSSQLIETSFYINFNSVSGLTFEYVEMRRVSEHVVKWHAVCNVLTADQTVLTPCSVFALSIWTPRGRNRKRLVKFGSSQHWLWGTFVWVSSCILNDVSD
jgi:hypothetical protein